MLENVEVGRALQAGLLAGVLMSIAGYVPRLLDQPVVDFGEAIETKIFRYHSNRTTPIGLLVHLGNAMLLGVVFAIIPFQRLGLGPVAAGLAWGGVLWLVAMLVVLPRIGEGIFGRRMGPSVSLTSLLMHLVYGLTLGVAYGR